MGFLFSTAAAAVATALAAATTSPHGAAAAVAPAAATAATPAAVAAAPTDSAFMSTAALRSRFADGDFAIDATAITGSPTPSGVVRPALVGSFPVLGLPDVRMSFAFVTLEGGAFNQAHTHPRGAELLFLTKGKMDVFFVEDNVGPNARTVVNTLNAGGATVFGQGLIHGEQCVSEGPCEFVAVFNNPDAGGLTVAPRLCAGPLDAVAAALGTTVANAKKVCRGVAMGPSAGPSRD